MFLKANSISQMPGEELLEAVLGYWEDHFTSPTWLYHRGEQASHRTSQMLVLSSVKSS